jgi:hypothetical protein
MPQARRSPDVRAAAPCGQRPHEAKGVISLHYPQLSAIHLSYAGEWSLATLPLPCEARKSDGVMDSVAPTDDLPQEVIEGEEETASKRWFARKRWWLLIAIALLVIGIPLIAWLSRDQIADDLIASELDKLGLEASYEVAEIGTERQILRNLVIGDPDRPDFTAEEVQVEVGGVFDFAPLLGRISLIKPRLYGTYLDGKLSFGALDPLIFTDSEEPFALPEYDIALVDGRAQMITDYGTIGVKAQGEGRLDDGFTGILAVVGPELAAQGCKLSGATLYGDISITRGAPSFAGPIRAENAQCTSQGFAASDIAIDGKLALTRDFGEVDGEAEISAARLSGSGVRANKLKGDTQFSWKEGLAVLGYDLASAKLTAPQGEISEVSAQGSARIRGAFDQSEVEAKIAGVDLRPGETGAASLDTLSEQVAGTLLEPLLARIGRGLGELGQSNTLTAQVTAKQTGQLYSVLVPSARLRGANGRSALALSRFEVSGGGSRALKLAGNFVTSGEDLPALSGRMEQVEGRDLALRIRMEEFREGDAAIGLPQMTLAQSPSGALTFDGIVTASGAIPGGAIRSLAMPVKGDYSSSGTLTLGRECTPVRFDALELEEPALRLDRRQLRLCPQGGRPLATYGAQGLALALNLPSLNLGGSLNSERFAVTAGSAQLLATAGSDFANLDISGGASGLRANGNFDAQSFAIASDRARFSFASGAGFSDVELSGEANGVQVNGDVAGATFNLATNSATLSLISEAGGGYDIATNVPALNVRGDLGGTPFTLTSGAAQIDFPGQAKVSDVKWVLGGGDEPNLFEVAQVEASLGETIQGTFANANALIAPVPLDVIEANGSWSFNNNILRLGDAEFRVLDRNGEALDRFEPLIARDATLALENNIITANALLRHPASDMVVSAVDITHNLSNTSGNALLTIDGLNFSEALQPQATSLRDCYDAAGNPLSDPMRQSSGLSCLPFGIISEVKGPVSGTGEIQWTPDKINSTGSFTAQSMDLAAAFGPVRGVKGTIEFTDLLGLTSAPNQRVEIASVNPGIEALKGVLNYELRDGTLLSIKGAQWPFMGGKLIMDPVDLNFSEPEVRRYVFEVDGLNSAAFIAQMELTNLSATGLFDGRVPIVFDKQGNGRIENSTLTARAPGGNVSYIGALTYEDMGIVSNFAFNMLKSLDYTGMEIGIEGPLTGILTTKVEIDGVQQGQSASRNILTRELAKLPIKLNVNVNAPFMDLMTTMRSLYDPEFIDMTRIEALRRGNNAPPVEPAPSLDVTRPDEITPEKPPIQLEESEPVQ